MAGIGLQLHRLVAKNTYLHAVAGYFSAAIISAGPCLSAILALLFLGSASITFLGQEQQMLLFATLTYIFTISLALAGGPQMIITRYLADRLYLQDVTVIAPTCTGVLLSAIPLSILTVPFLIWAPFDPGYRLLVSTLFVTLSLIWLAQIFLSATRSYWRIVCISVGSYAISLGAALGLGQLYELFGTLSGFILGQIICLALLVAHIYREFPPASGISLAFLKDARRYWTLAPIGLLLMLGIWIDNLIYWFSPYHIVVAGFYRVFPAYDMAKLLAYLLTIPSTIVFLVHFETNFYQYYRQMYRSILEKGTLPEITQAKAGMTEATRNGLLTILKVQSIVAFAALLLAPDIAAVLRLPASWVSLFRVEVLGGSGQFLMLIIVLILLYLDQRRATLCIVATFAAANMGFTFVTIWLGDPFYGLGYLLAAIIACPLGGVYLRHCLNRLEYLTFMLQPMQS